MYFLNFNNFVKDVPEVFKYIYFISGFICFSIFIFGILFIIIDKFIDLFGLLSRFDDLEKKVKFLERRSKK